MEDDLELGMSVSADGTEITLKITNLEGERISLRDLVLELEMYIMELQRAREQDAARTYPLC